MIEILTLDRILQSAGEQLVMPAYQSTMHINRKHDGSIVTETDIACQHYIQSALQTVSPDIHFLGEEMDEREHLDILQCCSGRYWCLDPLDGTTNFAATIPCFALSLALIEDGVVTHAAIYDPVRSESFSATLHGGTQLNHKKIQASSVSTLSEAVGYIDFKRLDAVVSGRLSRPGIYRSQRNLGSCALEWAWLATGRGEFIVHGGEKLWDFSAGSLIASEAGCVLGDFSGAPLFPTKQLSTPIFATCNKKLHTQLQPYLAS